jgi:hypothetical protein
MQSTKNEAEDKNSKKQEKEENQAMTRLGM